MFNEINNQAQSGGLLAGLQVVGGRSGRTRGADLQKAQERYGIQDRSTVLTLLRRHGRQDWAAGASFPPMSTVPKAGAAKPLTPKQQIKAPRV